MDAGVGVGGGFISGRRPERLGRRLSGDPRGRRAPRSQPRPVPVYECVGCGKLWGAPAHGSRAALDRCLLAALGYDWRVGSRVSADEVPAAFNRLSPEGG